ncbi:MAG TPA: histidine phosphatase family protein [Candidatus Choladousia intestinigallinarum]|nr:histidine phosphatase family protein [Candidatus Choladousia intestinigallinarum]
MRLYIVRHGETQWNTEGRLQGRADIPLNEKGRAVARATALGMKDIPFDMAFTSPLVRAKETAQIILGDRQVPLEPDARIQEINFGEMEGCRIRDTNGEVIIPLFQKFFDHPSEYLPPKDGETILELCGRTAEFLEELKNRKDLAGKTILAATHGAASRAMLLNITRRPVAEFWGKGVPKNCSVSVAELEHGEWILKKQDVCYYENL